MTYVRKEEGREGGKNICSAKCHVLAKFGEE
jgi:hypothetical protein